MYRSALAVPVALTAALAVATATVPSASAQAPAVSADRSGFELTVANIMQGPELVGASPSSLRWSPDGQTLYFVWKQPDEERRGLYRVGENGGAPARVPDAEAQRIERRLEAVYPEDRRHAAYSDGGKLYLFDVRSGDERVLVSVPGRLSRVQIAPGGDAVYYVVRDNLHSVDVASGSVAQLTDIRHGSGPADEKAPAEQQAFLKVEQRYLLSVFEVDSTRRARDWPPPPDTAKVDTPKVFYVERGRSVDGFWVAPDGSHMAFDLSNEATEARLAWVPDYVTEDGYTRQAPRKRTNVGDEQRSRKSGIMDLVTGDVTWVDHGLGEREINLQFRGWSEDSDRLLFVGLSDDVRDRWLLVVDAASGESRVVDHLHDEAWIGGPGSSAAGWMPDCDHVWFISEATGFAHLYTIAVGGGEPTPLTTGPWEVLSAQMSRDKREWYLLTSESSPHERGFYRMNLDGTDRRLITKHGTLHGSGRFSVPVVVSPDGKRLAALYSSMNHPPELYLQDNDASAKAAKITESTKPEFRARDWMLPEIVYFPARDGVDVPARLYRPADPNGAAVIFVHGAGYTQNVHAWWSSYYREYMFHNLLSDRGYTVLDIDYRGSAGYGRDWRTAIRKHMGSKDLSDQVDGARFLVDSLGVEPHRIGIYGGSYGGFITLMAMFTEPGTFAAGDRLGLLQPLVHVAHTRPSAARHGGLPSKLADLPRGGS
jgi:dipeptidyl aminopeptidase/acylaminoacyl peptidase